MGPLEVGWTPFALHKEEAGWYQNLNQQEILEGCQVQFGAPLRKADSALGLGLEIIARFKYPLQRGTDSPAVGAITSRCRAQVGGGNRPKGKSVM